MSTQRVLYLAGLFIWLSGFLGGFIGQSITGVAELMPFGAILGAFSGSVLMIAGMKFGGKTNASG